MNLDDNSRVKIFLVGGFPASGKTSLIKMAEEVLQAKSISLDEIHTQMLQEEFLWRSDRRIEENAYKLANKYIDEGKNVLLDSVYMDYPSRERAIDAFKERADVYMIHVDTPIEICKQRNSLRKQPVEDWAYEKLIESSSSPSLAEGFENIFKFDNLTEYERDEMKTGNFSKPHLLTEVEIEKAIKEGNEFLQQISEEVNIEPEEYHQIERR